MGPSSALVLGALAGFAVAVPVGPIGVLLLREGVVHGTRVAIGAGLGVATVDLLYATVAVAAGAPLGRVVAQHETAVRWLTAVVLVAVAVVALRSWWRERARPDDGAAAESVALADARVVTTDRGPVDDRDLPSATRGGASTATSRRAWVARPTPAAAYARFVGLTIVNPATLLIFATVAVGLAARLGGDGSSVLVAGALFVAGAGLASAAWQTVLGVVSGALGRVVGERGRAWASPVGAVVVLVLAAVVLLG